MSIEQIKRITELEAQVADLLARVAALEAKAKKDKKS